MKLGTGSSSFQNPSFFIYNYYILFYYKHQKNGKNALIKKKCLAGTVLYE